MAFAGIFAVGRTPKRHGEPVISALGFERTTTKSWFKSSLQRQPTNMEQIITGYHKLIFNWFIISIRIK